MSNPLIPLGEVVHLESKHTLNVITNNEQGSASCPHKNRLLWEKFRILRTEDGKYIINSRKNGLNLQVKPNGHCDFANSNEELWEKFDIEIDESGSFFFISCHTGNLMQCKPDGTVVCQNTNRQLWEAWNVIRA
jgi:hypothetical protein